MYKKKYSRKNFVAKYFILFLCNLTVFLPIEIVPSSLAAETQLSTEELLSNQMQPYKNGLHGEAITDNHINFPTLADSTKMAPLSPIAGSTHIDSDWIIAGVVIGSLVLGIGAAIAVSSAFEDKGTTLTTQTILGSWYFSGNNRLGNSDKGTIIFYNSGDIKAIGRNINGPGFWHLSGTNLSIHMNTATEYNGKISGNSKNFTMVCSNGWSLYFSR